jgi:hypothetical protein
MYAQHAWTCTMALSHGRADRRFSGGLLQLLPISRTIRHVEYEWDNGKAAQNLHKHGVDFKDAIAALQDLNRLEEIDTHLEYGGTDSGHRNGSGRCPVRDRHVAR